MHCLQNYNEKYIIYCVEHYISSDKILELHRVETRKLYYGINYIYFSVIRITQFRKLYCKITLCIKLYSNLGNYLKYTIALFFHQLLFKTKMT